MSDGFAPLAQDYYAPQVESKRALSLCCAARLNLELAFPEGIAHKALPLARKHALPQGSETGIPNGDAQHRIRRRPNLAGRPDRRNNKSASANASDNNGF